MTGLIGMFVFGAIVGAAALGMAHHLMFVTPSALPVPYPPSRQHRKNDRPNRRRRDTTASMIDHIAALHKAQALSYPQAVTRIRALEVAPDTAHRVLDARMKSH